MTKPLKCNFTKNTV